MPTATLTAPDSARSAMHAELPARYPSLIARMGCDREQLLAHQRTRLREALRDAIAGSPFHACRLAGIDSDAVDPADLSALPVMTKAQMMDELDDVLTDRRITRASAEAALAATTDEPVALPGGRVRRLAHARAHGPAPRHGRPAAGRAADGDGRRALRGPLLARWPAARQRRRDALPLLLRRTRLARALAGAGLDRPAVSVRTVAGLGRDPETGKLTRFVPLG